MNGNRTDIFENTLFEPICAELRRNGAKLSIVNELISMTLSEVENQTISDDKNPNKFKLKPIRMEWDVSQMTILREFLIRKRQLSMYLPEVYYHLLSYHVHNSC